MNIENIALPDVLRTYDYETLLQQNIAEVKKIIPDWYPSEGDIALIILEALAYREMHLRAEFNELARAFFLSTTKANDLDNYAVFYGLKRLQGSKPTAQYRFELTAPLEYEVTIPKGSTLIDDGGTKRGILLDDVFFKIGSEVEKGVVELQEYIESSNVTLTTLQTPLPYIANISKIEIFHGGKSFESDEHFRKRILISLADKSTAGSEESYKSYTYKADSKIEDVSVFSRVAGEVLVYIYAPDGDKYTLSRVREALNAKDIRPLTDKVIVDFAKEINFTINATLKIFQNNDTAQIYMNAMESLDRGLESIKKIGADVTLSELNDFLRVAGVKEVVFHSPTSRLNIGRDEIAICNLKQINYEVYNEQY